MSKVLHRITSVSSQRLAGRVLRWPLRMIPTTFEMPILTGRLRGLKWTVGAGNHSCWIGVYERSKQQTFAATVHPGAVVLDVGAHAGYYTLLFSRLVGPSGRVIAIEPSPRNLVFLRRHIALNRIDNVEVIEGAAWNADGRVSFAEGASSYNGAVAAEGSIEVAAFRIDGLRNRGRLPRADVIKIDVEGAEDAVLEGGASTIEREHPIIFLATHGPDVHERCVELLNRLGYASEAIRGDPLEWRELAARPVPRLNQTSQNRQR